MNKKWIYLFVPFISLFIAGIAWAQISTNFDNSWNVVSAGGIQGMKSNQYAIFSTSGQLANGEMNSGQHSLGSGYWYGVQRVTVVTPPPAYPIYLPMVVKNYEF